MWHAHFSAAKDAVKFPVIIIILFLISLSLSLLLIIILLLLLNNSLARRLVMQQNKTETLKCNYPEKCCSFSVYLLNFCFHWKRICMWQYWCFFIHPILQIKRKSVRTHAIQKVVHIGTWTTREKGNWKRGMIYLNFCYCIEHFNMSSWQPFWCPKTMMKRWPC